MPDQFLKLFVELIPDSDVGRSRELLWVVESTFCIRGDAFQSEETLAGGIKVSQEGGFSRFSYRRRRSAKGIRSPHIDRLVLLALEIGQPDARLKRSLSVWKNFILGTRAPGKWIKLFGDLSNFIRLNPDPVDGEVHLSDEFEITILIQTPSGEVIDNASARHLLWQHVEPSELPPEVKKTANYVTRTVLEMHNLNETKSIAIGKTIWLYELITLKKVLETDFEDLCQWLPDFFDTPGVNKNDEGLWEWCGRMEVTQRQFERTASRFNGANPNHFTLAAAEIQKLIAAVSKLLKVNDSVENPEDSRTKPNEEFAVAEKGHLQEMAKSALSQRMSIIEAVSREVDVCRKTASTLILKK